MKEAARIVIKGGSGPAPDEEAYSDKISVSRDSMAYEYTPLMEGEINVSRKWSYRTTSPIFKKMFREAAAAAVKVCGLEEGAAADGIGETAFRITFADRSVIERVFRRPGDDFKGCFDIIKKMVPPCEYVPAVLLTSDDYGDDLEGGSGDQPAR